MRSRYAIPVCLLFVCAGIGTFLATPAPAQTRLVYVEAERVFPPDGAAVYEAYCAPCHGVAGRGNGPASPYLDKPVANLTLIAARDGRFDRVHVMSHIGGGYAMAPMPRWHQIIHDTYKSDLMERLVIRNVALHVESMQVRQ